MIDQSNIENLIKQAKNMQEKMNHVQKEISAIQTTGESGAGLVKVTINGKYHCINVNIENSLFQQKDKEILEDLITAAFNDANRKMKEEKKNKMSFIAPEIPFNNTMNPFI